MPKKCLTRQTGNRINKKYMKYVELIYFQRKRTSQGILPRMAAKSKLRLQARITTLQICL